MLEGTTFIFSSWTCTTNGSGGYTSHLITPEESETTNNKQDQLADYSSKLNEMTTT